MKKTKKIIVQKSEISIIEIRNADYISLTDMTSRFEGGGSLIEAWLRNKNTIEFLGVWENINNPDFNSLEFEGIKNKAGLNRFTMSAKMWTECTNGIGLIAKAGRYGGTFAHKDIAFEFGSWLSPEFKLYLIKEFQRLKEIEQRKIDKNWNVNRVISKINLRIQTDAIKDNLIPDNLPQQKQGFIYAEEADVLNVVLFGMTAKEWKKKNPNADGNMRDNATLDQLIVLSNLENHNALMIHQGLPQAKRIKQLYEIAIMQMKTLSTNKSKTNLLN